MKVVEFNKNIDNGDMVIERLEEALEMAKKGNIENCIIVMATRDGTVVDCWANRNIPFRMIGALESIKLEFMTACIEKRK